MKAKKTKPKFSVGQKVIFINDYGVNWGEKTLARYEWDDVRGHTYQYEGTLAPWFCSNERNFYDPRDITGIMGATAVLATDSSHYTEPTPVNY